MTSARQDVPICSASKANCSNLNQSASGPEQILFRLLPGEDAGFVDVWISAGQGVFEKLDVV